MSMPYCCNFWLLIPSNLDSSDFCPTPLTKEAQKPQHPTQPIRCVRLLQKDGERPKILYQIIPYDGGELCPLPDPFHLLSVISMLLHPSLLMNSPPPDVIKKS